jgi:hypothetical protein
MATGSLSPASASSVRASLRLRVEPRSTAKIAALSVVAMIEPSSSPSRSEKSSSQLATSPVRPADLAVPRGEPPLEQDQGQGDDADRSRQLVIAELDPADAIRADHHPEREKEHQRRQPHAGREKRGADSGGEDGPCDQDQLGVAHGHSLSSGPGPALPACIPAVRLQSRPWRRRTSPSRASRAKPRR